MTVELGSVYCYQRSGTKSRLIEKKETFQYIPLIENLQSVLQNKDIYSEVSQPIIKFLSLAVWFMCGKTGHMQIANEVLQQGSNTTIEDL